MKIIGKLWQLELNQEDINNLEGEMFGLGFGGGSPIRRTDLSKLTAKEMEDNYPTLDELFEKIKVHMNRT